MKTIFVMFLLTSSFMFFNDTEVAISSPQNETVTEAETFFGKVEIEAELGRKKLGCTKFGVCSVTIGVIGTGPMRPGKVGATLTTDRNGNVTSMNFNRSSMAKETIKKYFSKGSFKVGENFKTSLKTKEGQSLNLNLRKGDYRLKETKTGFIMNLK